MAKKESNFDLHDYDCDLKHRVVSLGSQHVTAGGTESGVDATLADRAVKNILLLDKLKPEGDAPINYLLSNPGGDEFYMAAIYDAIKYSKSPSIITVHGLAMSAGSVILQAGQKRVMMPSAWVMIHYGTWGTHAHPKISYNWSDAGKKMDKWMENIYLERIREKNPNFKLKDLQKMLDFDTILNAQDTVALGLADCVFTEDEHG